MPDELTELFARSDVPSPRSDLMDRIITHADRTGLSRATPLPANDRTPWIWPALAGIAATVVVGLFVWSQQPDDTERWAAQADLAGYGDLYAWVNGPVE